MRASPPPFGEGDPLAEMRKRSAGRDRRSPVACPRLTLSIFSGGHALVDGCCALLLWRAVAGGDFVLSTAWTAFFVYNLLAFAIQPLVGIAVDRLACPRLAAAVGALLVATAFPLAAWSPGIPYAAVLLCGLGNALFHLGGGVMSLTLSPGRATPVGLFVAPGAAGLVAGMLLGRAQTPAWPFVVVLVALAVVLPLPWRQDRADLGDSTRGPKKGDVAPRSVAPALELTIILLLIAVALRSYVGLAVVFPWKSDPGYLIALTAAVVLGKAGGGVLADRFGWRETAVGALLVSTPLLALGSSRPVLGLVGAAVFNLTMPVTLAAVAHVLRGHEAFAFGLTCLALFTGAFPVLAGASEGLSAALLLTLGLVASGALWVALGAVAPGSTNRLGAVSPMAEGGRG